jgi:hypothetical protein
LSGRSRHKYSVIGISLLSPPGNFGHGAEEAARAYRCAMAAQGMKTN